MSDDCETSEPNVKKSRMDEENVLLNKAEKKVGYNRCRKPTSTTDKCKSKNLYKVSLNMANTFNSKYTIVPPLTTSDRLCYRCLQQVQKMCESSQETTSESTSDMFSQDIDNSEQVDNLIQDEIPTVEVDVDYIKHFHDLLENMKSKFHNENTTKDEKFQLLTLLPLSWSYNDIKKHFNVSNHMIKLSRKFQTEIGPMSKPGFAKKGLLLPDETKSVVIHFYNSEDNTYILPGIKDCVKSKDQDGNVISEQKRLLLCTLKEFHALFKIDHPEFPIGFSTFAKLRPKHCIIAGSSGTHSVCVCSIHQNVKLLISGCSLAQLTQDCEFKLKNYKDVLKFIICDKGSDDLSPECYLNECQNCPGIDKIKEYLTKIFENNEIEEISYSQWISTPVTTLKNLTDDVTDFIQYFCDKVEKLLTHAFISTQQSAYIKALKVALPNGEIIVNLDFAENYAFVVQDAPPGFHWNNNQATVFVAYIYYKDGGEVKGKGFVVISDNLSHDTIAVFTYQKLLIDYLKNNFSVNKINYFSDGAPQQFKNYKNILNIYYHNHDFGIEANWHFFPTAHGKGACDGVGGSVKRAAAKASLRLPPNKQILTALSLHDWLKSDGHYENVEFRYSPASDYDKNLRKLNSRYSNKSRVKDLQKQHFIAPLGNGKVEYKLYSSSQQSKSSKIVDKI